MATAPIAVSATSTTCELQRELNSVQTFWRLPVHKEFSVAILRSVLSNWKQAPIVTCSQEVTGGKCQESPDAHAPQDMEGHR